MSIPRLQLFEFADFDWFPDGIRDLMTDYLHYVETRFRMHEPVTDLLAELMEETGEYTVIDLCSGGAGPVPAIDAELRARGVDARFVLTDKFPNRAAFDQAAAGGGDISFESRPVDATNVPRELTGIRTIYNGIHHFTPEAARAVLKDAVNAGQPIATFEFVERRVAAIVPSMLLIPIMVWVLTLGIKPRTFGRFLWTYLVPVVPLVVWWDGIVSHLRTYNPGELKRIAEPFGDYEWRSGRKQIRSMPNYVTYLIGVPKK
jgi:hypothetical protein